MNYIDIPSSDSLFDDTETLTDEDAVKQSVFNIVFIRPESKIYKSKGEGINLEEYLFEEISEDMGHSISIEITNALYKYEPRIADIITKVIPVYDDNLYEIYINYRVIDLGLDDEITFPLKKIR